MEKLSIIRTTYPDFIRDNSNLLESFEEVLGSFHRDLVKSEWVGLMITPENYWEGYMKELLESAEARLPNVTEMTYIEDSGEILAFALWYTSRKVWGVLQSDWKDFLFTELIELYVSPELRGRGVGKTLTRIAESDGRDKWAEYFFVDVLSNNSWAVALYEKLGCRPWFQTMVKKI